MEGAGADGAPRSPGGPPRPGKRNLPAVAGRQGPGRRARGAGQTGGATGPRGVERPRALLSRGRGDRVLLRARGASERRQIRGGLPSRGQAGRRGWTPPVRGGGRRSGVRPGHDTSGGRSPEHRGPDRGARWARGDTVGSREGDDRRRPDTACREGGASVKPRTASRLAWSLWGLVFVFLLFPDGRLPSRRWWPVAWISAIGITGIVLLAAFGTGPFDDAVILRSNPYAVGGPGLWNVVQFSWGLAFVGIIGSAAALVVRLRRSSGATRQQLKWLAYAGVIVVAAFVIASTIWSVFQSEVGNVLGQALIILALLLVPVAAGIAILRHRLYEIDVVIKKTVVFGVLAAFITLVYAAIVLLVPILVFDVSTPVSLLPAVAAVFVALAFQPFRRRANRLANRLVFGRRATPYELLSEFSGRVGNEQAIEDVLPRMARVLGEGTGARRADVWLRVGGNLRRAATWPPDGGGETRLPFDGDDALPNLPDTDLVEPVAHRGEVLGALSLAKPRGETVRPAEETLLRDLASQAGAEHPRRRAAAAGSARGQAPAGGDHGQEGPRAGGADGRTGQVGAPGSAGGFAGPGPGDLPAAVGRQGTPGGGGVTSE